MDGCVVSEVFYAVCRYGKVSEALEQEQLDNPVEKAAPVRELEE
ncbi:hypothetical protein [Nostoc sp. FACHB-888]|nr:hypothetical protein [Nostoc sp. FACHB-888]